MFRMIMASITSFFNVIRINMNSLANLSAAGNIISSNIVEDQLAASQNYEATQQRLKEMGIDLIVELPQPKAKAKGKPKAKAKAESESE